MGRRWAREKAFQLLYQLDVRPEGRAAQIEAFLDRLKAGPECARSDEDENDPYRVPPAADPFFGLSDKGADAADLDYVARVVPRLMAVVEQLDARLQTYLKAWTLERLPKVDRALLRLGAYEILYEDEVPKSVSINEIVLLSKLFAAEESRAYINAVLANFEKGKDGAPRAGGAESDA